MIAPQTWVFPAAARACALVIAAVLLTPAAAQGQMLRGSFDALPDQDSDFSPYALGPAPDTAFGAPPFEREGGGPPPLSDPPPRESDGPGQIFEYPYERRDNPYEQLGIRAGAFLIKPSLEIYGGYDTNPASSGTAEGSALVRSQGRVDVESDWIRHAFRGRLQHTYRAYDEFPERDAPGYSADAALRLDARRDLRFDFAVRGSRTSDTRGDTELVGVTTQFENDRYSASAGLVYKPNRLSISPTVEFDRRDFGDPDLDDRDYSQYNVRLRTGYELSPAAEPFIEVSANQRIYDLEENSSGIEHDAKGYRIYGGLRFEPDPIWALEGKVGYGHQEAEDPFIPDLDGLVARGSLIWRPSVLTEVRLNAERNFESSTVECCAIATRWRANLEFEHEFRSWLIFTGEVNYEDTYYESIDHTLKDFDAELGLEYKFNRTVSAKARVAYEKLDSSDDSEDYDAAIFELGLRVQR